MTKKSPAVLLMAAVLFTAAGVAHAQVTLDSAIRSAAAGIAGAVGDYSVAVPAMQAGTARMSDHLINEFISAFVGLGVTVVDRAQIDLLSEELHFSMTGLVDDATAQAVGRFMGVRFIVTGSLEPLAGFHRLRVRAVEVETAAIRAVYTVDVPHDGNVAILLDGAGAAVPVAAGSRRPPQSAFSFGGGVFLDLAGADVEGSPPGATRRMFVDIGHVGGGVWAFAGTGFAVLSAGLLAASADIERGEIRGDEEHVELAVSGTLLALDFGLTAKYRFGLPGGTVIFPMLGGGYQLVVVADGLAHPVTGDTSAADFSVFKITFGAGADFSLGRRAFLRVSALGYYRFASRFERDRSRNEFGNGGAGGGFGGNFAAGLGIGF